MSRIKEDLIGYEYKYWLERIMNRKCKHYTAENLQLITECGVELDYEYDTYCTYCGKEIQGIRSEAPKEVYDLAKSND